MKGKDIKEPDSVEEMRTHHLLHRKIKTNDGVFESYVCSRSDHVDCMILAGKEYDHTDDSDRGVYYHACLSYAKRNLLGDQVNWELAPDEEIDRVHGPGGQGRNQRASKQ